MRRSNIGLLIWATVLLSALAQPSASRKEFDVAAVRPNVDNDNRFMIRLLDGGRITVVGVPLRMLIMEAYDLRKFQVSGGPSWMNTERWDVQAKAEGVESRIPIDQFRLMLQSLLEDRFQLKSHRETKEATEYVLMVSKNRTKLDKKIGEGGPAIRMGRGSLTFKKAGMAALAMQLSLILGGKVIDKTGLMGQYDFELHWTPEPGQGGPEAIGLPPVAVDAPPTADPSGASIFTAIQEQLGLRLESQKGPVEVLVVDHVERASAN